MKLQKINLNLNLVFFLLIFILIFFIFESGLIHKINDFALHPAKDSIENKLIFEDWSFIFDTLRCKKLGYDITVINPCDPIGGRVWWSDNIQFYIPFYPKIDFFYYTVLPWLQILFFFVIISKLLNQKNLKSKILIFLIFFSPQILLLLSRMNNDLIIFILIYFILLINNNYLSSLIISYISLAKFYPIISVIILILNKESLIKNLFFLVLTFLLVGSFLIYSFDLEAFKNLFEIRGQLYGKSYRNFSFISLIKYYSIAFDKIEIYKNYIVITCFVSLFLFISLLTVYFINKKNELIIDIENFKFKIFIVGTNLLVFCYIVFQNSFYREVFLIFSLPFIIEYANKNLLIKFLFQLIYLKYLIGFLLTLSLPTFGILNELILAKLFFDYIIISILFGVLIKFNLKICQEKFGLVKF